MNGHLARVRDNGRFLTLMAQFIEDEGISEARGRYEWLSRVKNRAKFKMPVLAT